MTGNTDPAPRKVLTLRRSTLLASVTALGLAVAVAGPANFTSAGHWVERARAAEIAPAPTGFGDLVAKVKPAVISVRVKIDETVGSGLAENNNLPEGFPPGMRKYFQQFGMPDLPNMPHGKQIITGEGSGFFISPDGYAVTNNHVVDHANTVEVKTDDGASYQAKVIGTDRKTDLALIKVDADKTFAYVKFADKAPRVGDWVVAVGNPFGLGGTVTAGIVSARGRDIGAGTYDDYIQIDAPINKGNSGGPAFNVDGDVIGVNTAIFSPSGGSVGIGFDIPASTAKVVIAQLKAHGRIDHAYLGVQVQPVTADIAESLGLKHAKGALVAEPMPDGPAAKAGIKAGDVITAINGHAVANSRDLARTIGMMTPGSKVSIDLLHNGEPKTLDVALAKVPDEQSAKADTGAPEKSASKALQRLGLALAPANEVAGAGERGVAVVGVDPNGPAAARGVQTGDVILDIGGKSVAKASDVRGALQEARANGKRDVLMRVKSARGTRFVALPVGEA